MKVEEDDLKQEIEEYRDVLREGSQAKGEKGEATGQVKAEEKIAEQK